MEELCQPTMNGRGGPIAPVNIQATDFGLKNHMIQQVQNIFQFHGLPGDDANKHLDKFLTITQSESLFEAWECYKVLIDYCLNHNMLPITQIDTFYNGLTLRHRDTINAAARGTFMKRRPKECNDLIENMTAHHNDWDTSAYRVNSVTPSYETYGDPHSYYECQATSGYTQDIYATTGNYNSDVSPPPLSSSSKEVERDPKTIKDHVLTESTTRVPPLVVQPSLAPRSSKPPPSSSSRPSEIPPPTSSSSKLPKQNLHQPPIPYHSRLNKEKLQDKSDIQIHKFLQMFKKLHFNISLAEALALIPKYAKMLKYLLSNKEKLLGLVNTSLTKNCSAVLLKKLPEKLGDPVLNRSMDSDKYLEGESMQRPPLFEITQILEVVPFEEQSDDLKKKLAKNKEAKMVLYNALPKKEYDHVKDNKIDLLVQKYKQFTILEEESTDSGFARFNTIITSLKALDESFSSKNYVRKFLRALHPKWRAKVTTSDDEEYAMAVRNFKKFFRRKGKFVRQPREEKSHSDKGMRGKGRVIENAFISLAIVQNHLATKIKRPSLEKLERSKEIDIACKLCQELKLENARLKETQAKFVKFDKSANVTREIIRHKFIALDTPTKELLKEKNRTLEDMVNAMFLSLGLTHDMWGKAIISATYLLDKIPYKENNIVLMNYGWEEDYLEFGRSSTMDDEVVQDHRQQDDNDLQDERQDQPKEEEVEPIRSKRVRIEKLSHPKRGLDGIHVRRRDVIAYIAQDQVNDYYMDV
ncbi:hypothetical protein Tco_0912972 [Tanacetum coccineum]